MKLKNASVFILLFAQTAFTKGKLDFTMGGFSLQASTSRGSASVDSLGAYQIAYRFSVLTKLEVLLGYSMLASKIYTGDLGFGPDLGVLYYPLTSASPVRAESDRVNFSFVEYYKPYLGTAFHQRQYQSTQSTYAGFSLIGGTEYFLNEFYSLKAEFRVIRLVGPSQGTANEIDLLMGISFPF